MSSSVVLKRPGLYSGPAPSPQAPSSIPARTSAAMRAISSAGGGAFVLLPHHQSPARFRGRPSAPRSWPRPVSGTPPSRRRSATPDCGPSGPKTDVVMPCMTRLCARRPSMFSDAKARSACECMSMKPGTTCLPVASITRAAVAPSSLPMLTIRSPTIPMSAVKAGLARAVENLSAADEEVVLLGRGARRDEGGHGDESGRGQDGRGEGEAARAYHRIGAG